MRVPSDYINVQTGTKNTSFKLEQVKEAFMDPK